MHEPTAIADVNNAGTIAPGLSAGALAITRDLTLSSTSVIEIEIGGLTQGTQYDLLSEGGTAALSLAGTLSLSLIDGFFPSGADSFTILTSNQNLAGMFSNVAPGGRLTTVDGISSFQVDYGSGSPSVMLTNFIPEPTTGALRLLGARLLGCGRQRRKVNGDRSQR